MKKIVVESCETCPYQDHKGAFAAIPYTPVCKHPKTSPSPQVLPYDVEKNPYTGVVSAVPSYEIPKWCPLEDDC